jgi:hypothetical protein
VVDALLRLGISLKSWIVSGMLRVGGCMISSAMSALSSGEWIGCGKWWYGVDSLIGRTNMNEDGLADDDLFLLHDSILAITWFVSEWALQASEHPKNTPKSRLFAPWYFNNHETDSSEISTIELHIHSLLSSKITQLELK